MSETRIVGKMLLVSEFSDQFALSKRCYQGYLAQALSFEHQLSVIAIDASLHHSTVTAARAERIKKHYAAKLRKAGHGCTYLFLYFVIY